MDFSLENTLDILRRTPGILTLMLKDLSGDWTILNEGKDTWSAYDIVGHLIHGEKTDWVPRMDLILSSETNKTFEPFNRFAQFEASKGKTLTTLLDEFTALRAENIRKVETRKLASSELVLKGIHPAFGELTLAQLLATWAVHDLSHIGQVARVMAKQYKEAVGPWVAYLTVLQ